LDAQFRRVGGTFCKTDLEMDHLQRSGGIQGGVGDSENEQAAADFQTVPEQKRDERFSEDE